MVAGTKEEMETLPRDRESESGGTGENAVDGGELRTVAARWSHRRVSFALPPVLHSDVMLEGLPHARLSFYTSRLLYPTKELHDSLVDCGKPFIGESIYNGL